MQMRQIVMIWTHHFEYYLQTIFGFDMPEGRLLLFLQEMEPSTATELCAIALMRKVQVSRSLSKLRDLGFVTMSPNPHDQRSEFVQRTAKGIQCCEQMHRCRVKWGEILEQELTPAECKALDSALQKLQASAESLEPVIVADVAAMKKRPPKPAVGTVRSKVAAKDSTAKKPADRRRTAPRRLHLR
jgi:DNA-binding MarR family transcriptional regulator